MITALIIDDIEKARIALRSDLENYCPSVTILGEADGVESGIAAIQKYCPELIFLDIKMTDGTGFDLIEKIKKTEAGLSFKIIFTTAYDEYAIKAFKFSALDYLLKPVDPDDLVQAIGKVKESKKSSDLKDNLDVLLENMKRMQGGAKRIALNSIDKVQIVNVDDIVRCESQRNYTLFYLADHKQILVTKTLKDFEEMLEDFGFIRVHHSHLINLKYLKEYIKTESYAIMSDESHVPVSVRKKDQLLKHFGL